MFPQAQPKDTLINMRISKSTRDFIDHAAQTTGKGRSDFMLEAAFEKAEQVLLDRRLFILDDKQWDEFNEILDNPPKMNKKLQTLLATPAPWE